MLYDLNILWTPQTTPSDVDRTLRFSKSLGYDVVALNHTLEAPIPPAPINPLPQLGPAHPSYPPHTSQQTPQPPSSSSSSPTPSALPTVLRRATILFADPATNHRLSTLAAIYDLLAARPTNDKAFSAACLSMSEIALISLDLSVSQPFRFKPKPCMAAVHRGVLFEVCYGQLVSHGDPRARANFIANVLELVRATKGRGIVLSSEARAVLGGVGLRAPADVVNLMACWGLGSERGVEALDGNPRSVVVNEGLRRRSHRGVVDVVQAEGRVPAHVAKQGESAAAENGQAGQKQGANKQQQKQKNKGGPKQAGGQGNPQGGEKQLQQNNEGGQKQSGAQVQRDGQAQPGAQSRQFNDSVNGKRKHDGGNGPGGDGDTTLAVGMSKRQAKKLRLAAKSTEDVGVQKANAVK